MNNSSIEPNGEPARYTVDHGAAFAAAAGAGLISLPLYLFLVPALAGNGDAALVLRFLAEWMSTHPSHGNRIETINVAIAELFPDGIAAGLTR